MPTARREVAVRMKPAAVQRCIIEIKGHEDIRVSLYTNYYDRLEAGWHTISHRVHSLDIKLMHMMMASFI